MFESVRMLWREARGRVLWQEYVNLTQHMAALPELQAAQCGVAYASLANQWVRQFGPVKESKVSTRKNAIKEFKDTAKQRYDTDRGVSFGYALFSMHLEASYLPGEEAKRTYALSSKAIEMAVAKVQTVPGSDISLDQSTSQKEPMAKTFGRRIREGAKVGAAKAADVACAPRRFGVWQVYDDDGRRRESWRKGDDGEIAVFATREDAETTATALRFTFSLIGSRASCTFSVREILEAEATGGPLSPLAEGQIAVGATNVGKIRRALGTARVRLSDDPDKSQFCIEASAAVVRLIANALDVSLWDLAGREQVAFGVLGFLVSDLISQMISSPLDKEEDKVMFEGVSALTALDLSGLESSDADFAKQAGDHINKVSDEYNRLVATSGRPLKELGDGIRGWIDDPIHSKLDAAIGHIFTMPSLVVGR
jgi:hypothetical protein